MCGARLTIYALYLDKTLTTARNYVERIAAFQKRLNDNVCKWVETVRPLSDAKFS
jgi:hypothetical protein